MSGEYYYRLVMKDSLRECWIRSLKIEVQLVGYLVRTAVQMEFTNVDDAVHLEGELIFPMGEGSVMSGYAVDVNGTLVDGVVVEKEKSRQVFESESRDLINKPSVSIAQHVIGNVFKSRIFPLSQGVTRTIKITFVDELHVHNGVGSYHLPLHFPHNIAHFSLLISGELSHTGAPVIHTDMAGDIQLSSGSPDRPITEEQKYEVSWVGLKDQAIKKGIHIVVPDFLQQLLFEKGEEGSYFAVNDVVPVPDIYEERNIHSSVGLLWDASFSRRNPEDRSRDLHILKSYIEMLRTVTIDLYVFREVVEEMVSFSIDGSAEELISYLNNLAYDGGTSLRDLPVTGKNPIYLLFSDGLSTISSDLPESLLAPVYVISTADEVNHNLLKVIARKSGGEYLRFHRNISSVDLISKIGKTNFGFISAYYDKNYIDEVYPSIPLTIQGTNFKFAGKIKKNFSSLTIQLNYGYGTLITHHVQFTISVKKFSASGLVARFWAQRKIDELLLFPEIELNNSIVLELGKKFSIVTPQTSLIVLETLEQYLKYEIQPPSCLHEVYVEWHKLMSERNITLNDEYESRMNYILDIWKRRCAWWNADEANPESKEDYIIHFAPFGKGIDETQKKLTYEWAKYRQLVDEEKDKEELEIYRRNEKSEMEELAYQYEVEQEMFMLLEQQKIEEEQRLREEMRMRKEQERQELNEMWIRFMEENEKKEIEYLKERKRREQMRKSQEVAEYKKYLQEKREEEEKLIKEEEQNKIEREQLSSQLIALLQSAIKDLNQKKNSKFVTYFERRKALSISTDLLNWLKVNTDIPPDTLHYLHWYFDYMINTTLLKLKKTVQVAMDEAFIEQPAVLLDEIPVLSEEETLKYMEEEIAATEAIEALKASIAKRKQELLEKKQEQELMQMATYLEEEQKEEEAIRRLKESIQERKRMFAEQKRREEEESMCRYMEEESASSFAAQAMRERIEMRKRELSNQKKCQEDEQMMRYLAEENEALEATNKIKKQIEARKKEHMTKKMSVGEKKGSEKKPTGKFSPKTTGSKKSNIVKHNVHDSGMVAFVPNLSPSLIKENIIQGMNDIKIFNQFYNIAKEEAKNEPKVQSECWLLWHQRHESEWKEFEEIHFCTEGTILKKWNKDRQMILQQRAALQMKEIEKENRRSVFIEEKHIIMERVVLNKELPLLNFEESNVYQYYLNQRSDNRNPNFFVDVATVLFNEEEEGLAKRVLTTLSEMDLDNPQYLRIIVFHLMVKGEKFSRLIIDYLRRVLQMRPEEPDTYLYLAMVLFENANQLMEQNKRHQQDSEGGDNDPMTLAMKQYEEAVSLFNKIFKGNWDKRFSQIEVTALEELNRLYSYLNFHGLHHHFKTTIDNRLLSPVLVDLRICIMWDTDMTDVELEIIEPNGEKCNSFHNKTNIGGMLSRNFTHGHGPQEYLLRKAIPGTYTVMVKLYSGLSKITGTTVLLQVTLYYSHPQKEAKFSNLTRLHQDKTTKQLLTITF